MKRTKRLRPKPKGPNHAIGDWIANLRDADRCWWCGEPFTEFRWREVHHVQRRSSCHPDYQDHQVNLFLTCMNCHDGPLATADHAEVLAQKLRWDPESFCLETWLKCRDGDVVKAPDRVTLREVVEALLRRVRG